MKNTKGDKGFIINIYNGFLGGNTEVRGETLKVKITPVEVKSCGRVQMTLEHLENGKMSKTFHDPDRQVYTTREDAEDAAKGLHAEWVANSIALTKTTLISHGAAYSKYDWWPKSKAAYEAFISSLRDNRVELSIV